MPIYWLNGPRAAADYADFYDGAWGHRNPGRNEHGASVDFGRAVFNGSPDFIFTGSQSDGTADSTYHLGTFAGAQAGAPGFGAGHEIISRIRGQLSSHPLYGLSEVFRVEGESAADNADLSDLRVDGTSVANFAAATTSYTAGVEHAVDQVTIAASTRDPGAGLAYSPADADPDTDGHQVNLVVGPNTVTVTVSARDTTTTKAYTLTINREDVPAVSFGAAIYIAYEGSTAEVKVTLSADPGRQVTIPLTTTNQGGASDADYSGVPASVVFESGVTEQSFTFTATDDTVDDDGKSVTLGFGTLPAGVMAGTPSTATVSIVDDEVPADLNLIPPGLGAGDEFRLLFVTSDTRDAASTDIADYNGFVQEAAGAGHPDILSSSSGFRALGSTRTVDARDNTGTTHTAGDRGVPIYWLNGPRAAADYADFYDGAWGHRDPGRKRARRLGELWKQ